MSDAAARRVALFGATGTIGRAVALELVARGHDVTCVARSASPELPGTLSQVDVTDTSEVAAFFEGRTFDAVISCLASRTGIADDAWAIDHRANSTILEAASANGVAQFILLSAICVQKPRLAFQHAKLAFEAELRASDLTWSIIRPTAFFKSLSGQVERVVNGKPFLLFGDGELTRCKPISDADLARYIVSALDDPAKHNRILPIGGPGPAITPKEQGEMLFEVIGQKPRFRHVPLAIMDAITAALSLAGKVSKRVAAKAEYARIGRYYATESMLVWDADAERYDENATPEFGEDTLREHYHQLTRRD